MIKILRFLDIVVILVILFLMHKELYEMRDDNNELINKYNKLARATGNETLAFDYISEEFKKEVSDLLKGNKESDAVYLVKKTTRMSLEECKEFIDSLK